MTKLQVTKCVNNIKVIAEIILSSADNQKKYSKLCGLVLQLFHGIMPEYRYPEKEICAICDELKEYAGSFNDDNDNLKIKRASRDLATIFRKIPASEYDEFFDGLCEADIAGILKSLAELDQEPATEKQAELTPQEWGSCAYAFYNEKDYPNAYKAARKALEGGNSFGAYMLGTLYGMGCGVEQDHTIAFNFYNEGAKLNNAACQYKLYEAYKQGDGCPKNELEAWRWLKIAADNGWLDAIVDWGAHCIFDLSSPSYDEAFSYISKAAEQGSTKGKLMLAFAYENGWGVKSDMNRAKTILRQLADEGEELAREHYNLILEKEREKEKSAREEENRRKREEDRRKQQEKEEKKKKRKGCLSWFLFLLIALGCGYQFWYKDYKRDVDAPRSYVFATNLFLRSSQVADVEYNRLGTIAYGSELITYSNEDGWAYVKANGQKGYVASDYLLGAEEFSLLNGVWGNDDAKEVVATAKCRKAILDFLKSGNLQTGSNGWQLYAKPKEMKPNSVSYPQLNDGYDHFTEFAFILKDNQSGKRKLALYAFEEDETPVFRYAEDAPAKGDIKAVTYSKWNNRYRVTYSGQEAVYTPPVKKEVPKEPEPAVSSRSIDLVKVDFANGTNKGVLLTGYGQQLYSDMQYLQSRVAYKKRRAGRETFLLKVNIIRPDGTPIRGAESPADCTFERNITLWQEEGLFELTGWGSPNSDVYPAGTYRYEIWHNGEKLSSSTVNVESRAVVSTEVTDDRIYESVDQMPEFPNGGMKGLMQYLSKNVKYPAVARERGVQGRVPVQFVINQDGSITDVTVVGGVDPYLDKEAVRVIKSMPKWRPGKKDGKAVRVKYTVPISFKLS